MAGDEQFKKVDAAKLERLVAAIYAELGVPQEDAALLGNALVDADLRGVNSHGCRWVSVYARNIRNGGANLQPVIRVVRDDGATCVLDGDGGLGHILAARAMKLAIQRAKEHGVGVVSLRNSQHIGALAYYTQMAANAECLGYCTTNAGVVMVPPGGREKIVGLNPLSWAAPTARPWSFNLDMATSVVAGSKLGMASERGETIPLGWAIDRDGNPTDDPKKGQEGGILPLGGPKGYGLSVMLDIMAGVLSGGRFGRGLGAKGSAQLYQALDIAHFIPMDDFKSRMEELIQQIKGSALAPGSKGIFFPGEIEYNLKQDRRASGLPLDAFVRGEIKREAEALGLAYEIEL
ncbi:MAG TPA: Ldh family oxidoreductase [Chloroflexota bacterium]|nr:Ldh family oxidoreductase [Chloroflexota bacterium]